MRKIRLREYYKIQYYDIKLKVWFDIQKKYIHRIEAITATKTLPHKEMRIAHITPEGRQFDLLPKSK